MTKSTLELRRLIYGASNVIIVDGKSQNIIKQIDMIRSTVSLDGFIFRPSFAKTQDLTGYTERDWNAIFAQYSLTYGWQEKYEGFSGNNPEDVLMDYFTDTLPDTLIFDKIASEPATFTIEPPAYYLKVAKDLATSKTILREQQLRTLKLLPLAIIESVFKTEKFTIKETEILFIKRLVQSGSKDFFFKDADQIVRFVTSSFVSSGENIEGQINRTLLKGIKVKIPTTFKKQIMLDLDKMNGHKALESMHKYKSFWKRLFKQLAWTSKEKLALRYPKAMIIRESLYNNSYTPANSAIEKMKAKGNYNVALLNETVNPGQMIRNLLQYLRYETGDVIARKKNIDLEDKTFVVGDMFTQNHKTLSRVVMQDATNTLNSDTFYDTLLKVNTKLLMQVLVLLKDKRMLKDRTERKVNGVKIQYTQKLPGLNPELVKIAKKKIKNAIKQTKRAQNSELGAVYISKDVKDYVMEFSGRKETSISLSGEYMPSGTIIKLEDIMKSSKIKDPILRVGLAWRGSSCDIDLSMNIDKLGACYYSNPVVYNDNEEIVMTSSGDITSCSQDIFSTELIDVDLSLIAKENIESMFNSAIMYSGSTFDKYEAYWFMSVIERENRVISGRKVQIKLDEMDYAVQITEETKSMMGLKFTFGKKNEVEVMNIPMMCRNGMNASSAKESFDNAIAERPKHQKLGKAFKMAVNAQQIVDSPEFADIVIARKEPASMKEGSRFLHPGRDMIELQEILF